MLYLFKYDNEYFHLIANVDGLIIHLYKFTGLKTGQTTLLSREDLLITVFHLYPLSTKYFENLISTLNIKSIIVEHYGNIFFIK